MAGLSETVLFGLLVAGVVTLALVARVVGRVRRRHRLHRRRANKLFMAGYRAAFQRTRRSADPNRRRHAV